MENYVFDIISNIQFNLYAEGFESGECMTIKTYKNCCCFDSRIENLFVKHSKLFVESCFC